MPIKIIENGKVAKVVSVANALELFVLSTKYENWEF